MATITGTTGADFIHMAGDGNTPPPGYNEVTGVTNTGDSIDPKGGNDIVYAGAGNDTLYDSAGTDSIHGGGGDDVFVVQNNTDLNGLPELLDGGGGINTFRVTGNGDSLDLSSASFSSIQGFQLETLNSLSLIVTHDQFNSLKDIQSTGAADQVSINHASNITFTGTFEGITTVDGSSGDDTITLNLTFAVPQLFLSGGDGSDTLTVDQTLKNERLDNVTLDGGAGNDVLTVTNVTGSSTLLGDDGNDTLIGGKSSETLNGGAGNDHLTGAQGQDLLTGGTGADSFIFKKTADSAPAAPDTITDFSHSDGDRIDLSKIKTGASSGAFHLGGSAFTHSAGELIQTTSGGTTLLQGDTNGDGVADITIQLSGAPVLVGGDFIL